MFMKQTKRLNSIYIRVGNLGQENMQVKLKTKMAYITHIFDNTQNSQICCTRFSNKRNIHWGKFNWLDKLFF